jgi:hypothetical protein
MDVIRHDHVAPHRDVVLRIGAFGEFNERGRDWIIREDRAAAMRASRDKEQRIIRNDAVESWRSSGVVPHPVAAALWAAWE